MPPGPITIVRPGICDAGRAGGRPGGRGTGTRTGAPGTAGRGADGAPVPPAAARLRGSRRGRGRCARRARLGRGRTRQARRSGDARPAFGLRRRRILDAQPERRRHDAADRSLGTGGGGLDGGWNGVAFRFDGRCRCRLRGFGHGRSAPRRRGWPTPRWRAARVRRAPAAPLPRRARARAAPRRPAAARAPPRRPRSAPARAAPRARPADGAAAGLASAAGAAPVASAATPPSTGSGAGRGVMVRTSRGGPTTGAAGLGGGSGARAGGLLGAALGGHRRLEEHLRRRRQGDAALASVPLDELASHDLFDRARRALHVDAVIALQQRDHFLARRVEQLRDFVNPDG